ncbi:MAG TPA: magnesium/cobalt transporter CorA [Solirubrobacteraceae bacterium]|nr:magnesium/cobalt transporter CorA [Solirubrobacteraceae bacterium]
MAGPSSGHGQPNGLQVPCLTDPDHDHVGEHLRDDRFFWLDVEDPTEGQIDRLGTRFHLHPLTVEDLRTFHQRPKLEEYDGYFSLVVYGVDPTSPSGESLLREVHVIISGRFIVTLHHGPFPELKAVRERDLSHRVRSEQFLVYRILDAATGTFFPRLSRIDDDIDEIEDHVIASPDERSLQRIFALKRDLVAMRRVVTPLRDLFARDADRIAELPGLQSDDRLYFRDLYDGLIRVADLVDSYRDLLSGATDLYLSTVANRQGEINKQLTVIATIFLPLTFLTGFFGQNFSFLTGHVTNTTWSFIVFGLGFLVVSVIGFWIFFRRKRWI